ncbi:MAG: hypothetical protein AAF770_00520 [Bacteroidota bacterium]
MNMNKIVSRLKRTFCYTLITTWSLGTIWSGNVEDNTKDYLLQKLDSSHLILKVTSKLYLDSFPFVGFVGKEKKSETEEERLKKLKKEGYEVDKPHLKPKEQAEVMFEQVLTANNGYLIFFLDERKKYKPVDMRGVTAESTKLILGSPNKPDVNILNEMMSPKAFSEIGRSVFAIMLMTPIADSSELRRRQHTIKTLVAHEKDRQAMKHAFTHLKKAAPSLLSLYRGHSDPLWSTAYKKVLLKAYASTNKKFTSWLKIELSKRYILDFNIIGTIFMASLFVNFVVSVVRVYFMLNANIQNQIIRGIINFWENLPNEARIAVAGYFLFLLAAYAVMVYGVIKLYIMYKTIQDYVSGRLADVQTLIEVAALVDEVVRNNPELEKSLGPQLKYTRKIINMQHENPSYNQLTYSFLANNFKSFGLFFNSTGSLLTTMTMLEENIHMLDGILFEMGLIEAQIAISELMQNSNSEQKNRYSYVNYLDSKDTYIKFDGLWSPIVGADKAVANSVDLDGKEHTTIGITGPNACGKSIFNAAINISVALAQSVGITPTRNATITPFGALFAFKEPKDDPGREKSLFASEVEAVKELLNMLYEADLERYKVFISFDEYLNSTNIGEALALQSALAGEIINTFPNAVSVISTHNFSLINYLLKHPKAQVVQVMIERYQDGSYKPLYTVLSGKSTEKVGIDLFLREISKNEKLQRVGEKIAKEARSKYKKIERQMEKL